jgi:ribosomal protein L40E
LLAKTNEKEYNTYVYFTLLLQTSPVMKLDRVDIDNVYFSDDKTYIRLSYDRVVETGPLNENDMEILQPYIKNDEQKIKYQIKPTVFKSKTYDVVTQYIEEQSDEKCVSCGEKTNPNAHFCRECGTKKENSKQTKFVNTRCFHGYNMSFKALIEFDDNNKLWRLPIKSKDKTYHYSEILDFQVFEDWGFESGGLISGGLAGIGSILHGDSGKRKDETCTLLEIQITLKNMAHSTVSIKFIDKTPLNTSSSQYKSILAEAQRCIAKLKTIIKQNS